MVGGGCPLGAREERRGKGAIGLGLLLSQSFLMGCYQFCYLGFFDYLNSLSSFSYFKIETEFFAVSSVSIPVSVVFVHP